MIIFNFIVRAIRNIFCHDSSLPSPPPFPSAAEIDAKLDGIVEQRGLKNNKHRESIVDLLDALNQPNDFPTRRGLYNELAGDGEYKGTAEQNTWMIQRVRRRFAEGQID